MIQKLSYIKKVLLYNRVMEKDGSVNKFVKHWTDLSLQ